MGKFEEILFEINDFGRYQKIRFYLICVAALMPAVVTYIHQFIAAKPDFKCNPTTTTTTNDYDNITIDQCFYYVNSTKYPCESWTFDKTYYQSTLTEEVNYELVSNF
jgi:hypothetical protein